MAASSASEPLISDDGESDTGYTKIHVQALDEIVAVNSFFTAAVFIGLSISFTSSSSSSSLVSDCTAPEVYKKWMFSLEVVAFSSYLMSSLTAQGLKLLIVLLNSEDRAEVKSARIKATWLQVGMLVTALGTFLGTILLTLSIVLLIQLGLGTIFCDTSQWALWTVVPMVVMIFVGMVAFVFGLFPSIFNPFLLSIVHSGMDRARHLTSSWSSS